MQKWQHSENLFHFFSPENEMSEVGREVYVKKNSVMWDKALCGLLNVTGY
jgi:hypothetical protein